MCSFTEIMGKANANSELYKRNIDELVPNLVDGIGSVDQRTGCVMMLFFSPMFTCACIEVKGGKNHLIYQLFRNLSILWLWIQLNFSAHQTASARSKKKCAHLLSIWILNDNLRTIFCFNIIYFFPLLNDIWHNRSMHRHTASWQTHAHTLDEQIVWQIVWNFS